MGHINNQDQAYRNLQKRLTQKVQGAPDSPTLMKILSILFSPEDAELARKLPHNFTSLDTLSKNFHIPKDELNTKLTDMAKRGLVLDVENNGLRYFTLPPVVVLATDSISCFGRNDGRLPILNWNQLRATGQSLFEQPAHSLPAKHAKSRCRELPPPD